VAISTYVQTHTNVHPKRLKSSGRTDCSNGRGQRCRSHGPKHAMHTRLIACIWYIILPRREAEPNLVWGGYPSKQESLSDERTRGALFLQSRLPRCPSQPPRPQLRRYVPSSSSSPSTHPSAHLDQLHPSCLLSRTERLPGVVAASLARGFTRGHARSRSLQPPRPRRGRASC